MTTIIYITVGLIFGGLATFFISKHFYKKGIKSKSLSTYIQFITKILSDIDPEVKKKLKVLYNEQDVEKLYQIQYVIANTGDISIRDVIKPLTLMIPNKGELLDVNILYEEPEGRNISYKIIVNEQDDNYVSFNFSLLNSNEYFVARLLVKGEPPPIKQDSDNDENGIYSYYSEWDIYEKYEFEITADDLPPKLISEPLPFDYEHVDKSKGVEWAPIFIAALFALCSFSLSYVLISFQTLEPSLKIFHFKEFFGNFSFLKFSILFGWILDILIVLLIIVLIFFGFEDVSLKKKPKIQLPQKLRHQGKYPF